MQPRNRVKLERIIHSLLGKYVIHEVFILMLALHVLERVIEDKLYVSDQTVTSHRLVLFNQLPRICFR